MITYYKRTKVCCHSCDRCLVVPGTKCKIWGARMLCKYKPKLPLVHKLLSDID